MPMSRPRLLDLFAGAGGAAAGYQRAGFYVVGVDIVPQPHYCGDEFVQADALEVLTILLSGGTWEGYVLADFAAIHASPPCQGYSRMRHLPWLKDRDYPLLIEPVRAALRAMKLPYVIENVEGAPLDPAFMLCGLSFGLRMYRHRLFESSELMLTPPHQRHTVTIGKGRLLGSRYSRASAGVTGILPDPAGHTAGASTRAAAEAMGIDWMNRDELAQAIPPAYTEWIGAHLLAALRVAS
jgi:DNA (cytosine-5)-methyltransferase 1